MSYTHARVQTGTGHIERFELEFGENFFTALTEANELAHAINRARSAIFRARLVQLVQEK